MKDVSRIVYPRLAYHHGLGVATERILQQAGEFGVPVRHVGALAVHQSGDDIPQGGEREIDLRGFLQALPCGARFPLSLRTLDRTGVLKRSESHQRDDKIKCILRYLYL